MGEPPKRLLFVLILRLLGRTSSSIFASRRLGAPPVSKIEGDREEQDQALDDPLPVGDDAKEIEDVADHG
jgi:hypothetical protein